MASSSSSIRSARKLWELTENETLSSFENWKTNLIYHLTADPNYVEFLDDDCTWKRKTVDPNRGFTDLKDNKGDIIGNTASQKAKFLSLCLGMIAGYAPVISPFAITRDARSIREIFQKLSAHYGFAKSGSSILDAVNVQRKSDESPEIVFQRIQSLIDYCLLSVHDNIAHHNEDPKEDEILSPTLENIIVCLWLKALHPSLPQLVKQRYATQLRTNTIASIREEISGSIDELLSELNDKDTPPSHVYQANTQSRGFSNRYNQRSNYQRRGNNSRYQGRQQYPQRNISFASCAICKQSGRQEFTHHLSNCPYLPEEDRRFIQRARLIAGSHV